MKAQIKDSSMKIVVPIPLNGELEIPLKQAAYFVNNYGAEITVLHVIHKYPRLGKLLSSRKLQKYQKKTYQKLKRLTKEHFGSDPIFENLKYKVKAGDLVSTILSYADNVGADLIIIKKAKKIVGQRRLLKQENADRLIANSNCPVLTIYEEHTINGINKILLPVDIIKQTESKVAWAKSLALRFNAEIRIVSVMNRNIRKDDSLAYKKGKRIEDEFKNVDIKTELVLLDQDERSKEDHVLEYAASYNPDLMLIMTHQENLILTKFLGNFAREIIHKAKMPVISMIPNKNDVFNGLINSLSEMSSSNRNELNKRLTIREKENAKELI